MRRFVVCCIFLLFIGFVNAQVVENPVFDRTDISAFRVKKVEITKDTTYVYCSFNAEEQSWVNISDKTYLENLNNGEKFPIVKVSGIPFGPEKKQFTDSKKINVVLFFPHVSANRINIIENEEDEAFNIYGIDLTQTYNSTYTPEEIHQFFEAYKKNEEEENWPTALEYTQKQLEAANYVEGIRSFATACSMYNMIMVYFILKEYGRVIEIGKKAINILRDLPQDSIYLDVLARTYGNVGTSYKLLKHHDDATNYLELSLATRRLKDGVGVYNYEEYLTRMANYYYYDDNFPKALIYGKEVVSIYENKFKNCKQKYGYPYVRALNNLCEFYQRMGSFDEAIKVGENAIKILNQGVCENEYWLKFALYNNLAAALITTGRIDEGILNLETILSTSKIVQLSDKNVLSARMMLAETYFRCKNDTLRAKSDFENILKEIEDSISVGKKNYPNYTTVLNNLYEINICSNPEKALRYLDKAINVQKEWNGDSSIAYANMLLEKVRSLWVPSLSEKINIDSLLHYSHQAINIVKRHINNSSYNMSNDKRKTYWKRYKEYFTWLIPTISGMVNTDLSNSLAYDVSLFYKGMLLSLERDFVSVIQNSNDKELGEIFLNYTKNLMELEKLYNNSYVGCTIDSLKSIINEEEFLLSQQVTRFNRQFKGTDYTWKEVGNNLSEGDVAIEILSYPAINGRDTFYDAYVIRCNSNAPQLVYLCREAQLKSLITDSIDYEGLSMLIWGNEKLCDAIKGAKNIYISTAGLLNTIGIEYLPIAGNRYIYDRFNIYRLSSTRELCMKNEIAAVDKVYLYGGLDYNNATEQLNHVGTFHDRLSRSTIESLTFRGGFEMLMGSMQEVELIKSEMSKHNMECVVLSGSSGTEESFKDLSGSHLGILHLSTHGMFLPGDDENVSPSKNFRFLITDETPYVDEEEMSLSHSFLVMSGGNALIHRDSIPIGKEDGFLTALEISHLDFTNLDLVVLSACETALGRIDTEGVYGLQRGFKKAGANTILMSLNKVDDEATKLLMVEFYRNLMSGKTKYQSLKDAQQYLRQVDNGKYDDPKYWASFIMLDGLN